MDYFLSYFLPCETKGGRENCTREAHTCSPLPPHPVVWSLVQHEAGSEVWDNEEKPVSKHLGRGKKQQ